MAQTITGAWERASLYYINQETFNTAVVTNPRKAQESSVCFPYSGGGPVVLPGRLGNGLPWPASANLQRGVELLRFATTMRCSLVTAVDMFALFFNGLHYPAVTPTYIGPVDDSDAMQWVSDVAWWATVIADLAASGKTAGIRAVDAVISRIAMNFPQGGSGEGAGTVELTCDWIASLGERHASAAYAGGTPVPDTGTPYQTKDYTFWYGGTAYSFVSGSIEFTNGLAPVPTAASVIPGFTVADIGATASVTMLLDEDTGAPGKGADVLLTAWEAAPTEAVLAFKQTDNNLDPEFPATITGPPTLSEIGGMDALTFNFAIAGSSTTYPHVTAATATIDASVFTDDAP